MARQATLQRAIVMRDTTQVDAREENAPRLAAPASAAMREPAPPARDVAPPAGLPTKLVAYVPVVVREQSHSLRLTTAAPESSRLHSSTVPPRLMTGARNVEARARIARGTVGGAEALALSAEIVPIMPRSTRPEPQPLRTSLASLPRTTSLIAVRALAAPVLEDDEELSGGDALDNLRASTNSYRAALDEENDSAENAT